jgi:tRNA 2-thiouridine synthesizing protein D
MANKTLTFLLMDPPFENARSTTALRIIDAAVKKGHHVRVFAYEGAVNLPFAQQKAHPNAVHGRDADQEQHPLPKEWITAIHKQAESNQTTFEWTNCGLCVDERGANETLPFVKRGSPADFLANANSGDNTMVIATK